MKSLCVATCQFSVEGRIEHNRRWVLKQISQAAKDEADVVHFSECALSGYAGVDLPGIADLDWNALAAATHDVMSAAKEHRVWVLLGSTHRLDEKHKPHNCVYVRSTTSGKRSSPRQCNAERPRIISGSAPTTAPLAHPAGAASRCVPMA